MKRITILILIITCFSGMAMSEVSPAKAFLYSLIIPGAGQRANGDHVKSGLFFMSELIWISGAVYYSNESRLAEERYMSYADTHFYYSGDDPDRKSYVEMWEILKDRVYAKTSLPYGKEGEYYELIGKLPELRQFWDESDQQDTYYDMRQEANGFYKTMNGFWGALIVNHTVSAVDAFISAKHRNISVQGALSGDGIVRMSVEVMLK